MKTCKAWPGIRLYVEREIKVKKHKHQLCWCARDRAGWNKTTDSESGWPVRKLLEAVLLRVLCVPLLLFTGSSRSGRHQPPTLPWARAHALPTGHSGFAITRLLSSASPRPQLPNACPIAHAHPCDRERERERVCVYFDPRTVNTHTRSSCSKCTTHSTAPASGIRSAIKPWWP
jgi:hypothetical protein